MAIVQGTNNSETLDKADGVTNNADTIFGGGGDDIIFGRHGADAIDGGSGSDRASYAESFAGVFVSLLTNTGTGGTAQGDTLVSIENLYGSTHGDLLVGDHNANEIVGLQGHDTLNGGIGDDALVGGIGNDTLKGGGGEDTLSGGSDIDTAAYNQSADGVSVFLLTDVAVGGDANGDELFSIENLTGSSHNDQLWGDNGANVLKGMNGHDTLGGNAGEDTLDGGNGNDTLYGGAGNDTMIGGLGDDTFVVDDAGETIGETANAGTDTVRSSTTYILTPGTSVESLTTTNGSGTTSMTLIGNDLTQVIVGNAGINVLRGLGGNDQLQGMGGNDTLTGHAGNDKFLFNTALNAATNVDTITDFSVTDDIIRLDDAIFAQAGAVGTLAVDAFHIGAAAADAEDRITYDDVNGNLFYDADGTGAGGSTLFAKLGIGLALTNADFAVV